MKRIFLTVLALVITIFLNTPAITAFAENPENAELLEYCDENNIDYLSSTQYQKLVEGLIEGDSYQDAYDQATGNNSVFRFFSDLSKSSSRSVNLDKNDKTTNTNFSKSGVLSTINEVLDLAKKIYDTTSDVVKNQEYGTDWDVDIPVASQLIGKTKIYYDNGVVELITLGVSFVRYYDSTPAIDMYRNKMQIYGIRQIISQGGYAATDFNVGIDAGFLPVQYDSSTMLAYGANSNLAIVHDNSDGDEVFTWGSGVYSALGFSRVSLTNANYYLYFASLQQQGITYKKFSKYVTDDLLYLNNSHSNYRNFAGFSMNYSSDYSSHAAIVYTVSDMQTNSYGDYVNSLNDKTYQPSVTYNSTYNAGDKITNNNYKNYGYDYDIDNKTWTYDTDYYNNWQTTYNETIINNYYNNYEIIDNSGSWYGDVNNTTISPFEEPEKPETQQPTEKPTQPSTEPPTQLPETTVTTASGSDPPATVPTGVPATLPEYTAKYTIDMTEYFTEVSDLSSYAKKVTDDNSFWIVRCMNYILNNVELFTVFLLLFLLALLRMFLWK